MVWLLSELIDEFCRNGHRLPAGNRANAVSVRPGCETWLHACRRDSFVALGSKSAIGVEQWHDKAGTRRSCAQSVSLTINSTRLRPLLRNEQLFADVEIIFNRN